MSKPPQPYVSTYGRFVTAVDLTSLQSVSCDVAVIGSGVAGLTVACALARQMKVLVLAKGSRGVGSTPYAQGGIAAAIGPDDSAALHAADTLRAAAGLANPRAVEVLTTEAADAIDFLHGLGANFDLRGGGYALTLEGGHSRSRVLHAGGDASGAEVSRALFEAAHQRAITVHNDAFLVDLLTDDDGRVSGAVMATGDQAFVVHASAVVLACGGLGQVFASTTSPPACTGDGFAAAFRAGAELIDLEFVQFHPTALVSHSDPRPLISEAMRGEGAVIRDAQGAPVMAGVHPDGDLAPRDVVARHMATVMAATGVDHLYLDARPLADRLEERFPTISNFLKAADIDPCHEMIPISPAAHYSIGGVRTTLDGEATLEGLYAVGEVASTGIHGANRLASNSLLEGVVFGRRAARSIASRRILPRREFANVRATTDSTAREELSRDDLRQLLQLHVGVVRNGAALARLSHRLERIAHGLVAVSQSAVETENMLLVADLMVQSALERAESRGAHYRIDIPEANDEWRLRQAQFRTVAGERVVTRVGVED